MKKTKFWISFSGDKKTRFLGYLITVKGEYYFQPVTEALPAVKIVNGDSLEWIREKDV